MNRRLANDLARWEAGDASLAELERRHPHADLSALTGLHARLTHLSGAPSPDPAAAWMTVAARLLDRGAVPDRSRRLRRPVVAALIAAVLAVPAVSYAAAPDAVRTAVQRVAELFPGVDDDGRHSDGPDDDAPPTTTSGPGTDQHSTDEQPPTSDPAPGATTDTDDGTDAPADTDDDVTPDGHSDDGAEVGGEPSPSGSDDATTTTEPDGAGSPDAPDD